MIESEAKAMIGLVLAVWPTPALPAETEQAWLALLRPQRFELGDFELALAELNETPRAFRPHISEVIAAAIANWHLRLSAELSDRALPEMPDTRPVCCREAENGLQHWLKVHASDEERSKAQIFGLTSMDEVQA